MRSILLRKRKRGNLELVELLEDQLQRRHFLVVGLADDDRRIAACERGARFLGEFDRARAVDEGEALAHELGGGGIELDAHAMGAGLGRGIADGRLVGNLALALDGAGAEQDRFEKRRLAAQIGAHECDAPRTLTFSAICCLILDLPFDCANAVGDRPSVARKPRRGGSSGSYACSDLRS